jgi:hypothetical protein
MTDTVNTTKDLVEEFVSYTADPASCPACADARECGGETCVDHMVDRFPDLLHTDEVEETDMDAKFKVGDKVTHSSWGPGTVREIYAVAQSADEETEYVVKLRGERYPVHIGESRMELR